MVYHCNMVKQHSSKLTYLWESVLGVDNEEACLSAATFGTILTQDIGHGKGLTCAPSPTTTSFFLRSGLLGVEEDEEAECDGFIGL